MFLDGFQIFFLRPGSTVQCIYGFSPPQTLAKNLVKNLAQSLIKNPGFLKVFNLLSRQFSVNSLDEISKKNPLKPVLKGLNPPKVHSFQYSGVFAAFFLTFFACLLLVCFVWFCLVFCIFGDFCYFLLYFPMYLASSLYGHYSVQWSLTFYQIAVMVAMCMHGNLASIL